MADRLDRHGNVRLWPIVLKKSKMSRQQNLRKSELIADFGRRCHPEINPAVTQRMLQTIEWNAYPLKIPPAKERLLLIVSAAGQPPSLKLIGKSEVAIRYWTGGAFRVISSFLRPQLTSGRLAAGGYPSGEACIMSARGDRSCSRYKIRPGRSGLSAGPKPCASALSGTN